MVQPASPTELPIFLSGTLGTSSSTQKMLLSLWQHDSACMDFEVLETLSWTKTLGWKISQSQQMIASQNVLFKKKKKKRAEFENCKIKLNFILSVLFCLRCGMAHSQQPDSPVLQRCLKSSSRCSISTGNQQHLVHRERSKCFPGSKHPVFVMISRLDLLLCEGTTVFIYVCR